MLHAIFFTHYIVSLWLIASKCFCEHKIGFPTENGILCEKNGKLYKETYCADDEWCIGATDITSATYAVASLCVKGNIKRNNVRFVIQGALIAIDSCENKCIWHFNDINS